VDGFGGGGISMFARAIALSCAIFTGGLAGGALPGPPDKRRRFDYGGDGNALINRHE
jgi:hypothetical protein